MIETIVFGEENVKRFFFAPSLMLALPAAVKRRAAGLPGWSGRKSQTNTVSAAYRRSEIRNDRIVAALRLVIAMGMFAATLVIGGASDGHHPLAYAAAVYGIGTLLGLFLAWRGTLQPSIAYVFVTFDIVLLAFQLLTLSHIVRAPPESVFTLPMTMLIFAVMVYASSRFRPWLVVYAAGLFVVVTTLVAMSVSGAGDPGAGQDFLTWQSLGIRLIRYNALPITIFVLCALILFFMVRRARDLLTHTIRNEGRIGQLLRYFSPNIGEELATDSRNPAISGRRQKAAVVFIDIRGFTAMAEDMAPEALRDFLSEFRTLTTRLILKHHGTVDKFIGDAIMAVFGAPEHRHDDARRALHCALDIITAVARWSDDRERRGEPAVTIGIGAHFGEVFAGVVGEGSVLEYTVLGHTVNIAERLERLTGEIGSQLVVSANMFEAAGKIATRSDWTHLPCQYLEGHKETIDVYRHANAPKTRDSDRSARPTAGLRRLARAGVFAVAASFGLGVLSDANALPSTGSSPGPDLAAVEITICGMAGIGHHSEICSVAACVLIPMTPRGSDYHCSASSKPDGLVPDRLIPQGIILARDPPVPRLGFSED